MLMKLAPDSNATMVMPGMPMRRHRALHEAPVAQLDIVKNGPPALWLDEVHAHCLPHSICTLRHGA